MRRPAGGHAFAAHGHNILANAAATRELVTCPHCRGWAGGPEDVPVAKEKKTTPTERKTGDSQFG